jgi:hypothetical protein
MWIVFFLLLPLLFSSTLALADPGFDEKYERGYNIFNPTGQYAPDNPLNPAQAFAPDNPLNSANRYNASTPFVVIPDLEDEEMRQGDFLSVECV